EGAARHAGARGAPGRVRGRLREPGGAERRPAGGAVGVPRGPGRPLHVHLRPRAPLDRASRPARDDGHRARSLPAGRLHALPGPADPRRLPGLLVLGPSHGRGAPPRHARDHHGDPAGREPALTAGAARAGRGGAPRCIGAGRRLGPVRAAAGRRFRADPRCLSGEPVRAAYAHVCALADDAARVPYDEPEVQGARRDALAWWIPYLGDRLVCLTTLAVDAVQFGGAITVVRQPGDFGSGPFGRILPGPLVGSDPSGEVGPPAGPSIERYTGVAWPGGRF